MVALLIGLVVAGVVGADVAYKRGERAADARWELELVRMYEDGKKAAIAARAAYESEQQTRIASQQAQLQEVERERDEARQAADRRDQERAKTGKPVDVVPIDVEWMRKRATSGSGRR